MLKHCQGINDDADGPPSLAFHLSNPIYHFLDLLPYSAGTYHLECVFYIKTMAYLPGDSSFCQVGHSSSQVCISLNMIRTWLEGQGCGHRTHAVNKHAIILLGKSWARFAAPSLRPLDYNFFDFQKNFLEQSFFILHTDFAYSSPSLISSHSPHTFSPHHLSSTPQRR